MVMFSEGESLSYPDYMDYRQTRDVFEGGVSALSVDSRQPWRNR